MTRPCHIIGVLDNGIDGLVPEALAHIRRADLVIGGTRTLELFGSELKEAAGTQDLTGRIAAIPEWIAQAQVQGQRVVVLATGDPLCHGIAAYLAAQLRPGTFRVLPNVSTVQLACARLGMAWQGLKILSVHGSDTGEWLEGAGPEHSLYPVLGAVERHEQLAILTNAGNSPDRIARMLAAEGLDAGIELAVAERLGREDEQVLTDLRVTDAAGRKFADPNVLLLWREEPPRPPVLFGLADDEYLQRRPEKGLITKREVRALSLARLGLRADSIVWDIGAGCGSIGLEAARLCPDGHVYAIEKDAPDARICTENRRRLGVTNYSLTEGRAPAGLDGWPAPDSVFIGGAGGELAVLIGLCLRRLRPGGILVMNFVTLENLGLAVAELKAQDAQWDITQLQASRSRPVLNLHRLAAENPVWILCASKENRGGGGND